MAGGVPDWGQTGKQELPDVTTQSQGNYGQDSCAGTDMPAAGRAEMQAECGQTLLKHIRQSKTGKMTLLKRQPLRLSSSAGHQSHSRIPKA